MPGDAADLSSINSLLDRAQQTGGLDPDIQRMLGSGNTTGSIDFSALTSGLTDATSGGASFLDPTYLMVSLFCQAVGMGFWIYGKRQGELSALFWGLACFAVSWDYTSALWWGIATAFVVLGKMVR